MDSAWRTGRVIDVKPWTKRSPRFTMKPPNGWRYATVDWPGLIFRDDAVGKPSVAPAEIKLPVWRSSHRTPLAIRLMLPNWVVLKPGPPGTSTRAPVLGS